MRSEIHPNYGTLSATCSCGNAFEVGSTMNGTCHPFYTGKQKVADTGGRIDRFNKRFAGRSAKK